MTPTPTTDSPVSVDDLAQEIRRIDGNNEKSAGYLAEAIMSFLASRTPNTEMVVKTEPVAYRCAKCDCHRFARCDERKPDGTFGPGPHVRCVNCKDVTLYPALASPPSPAEVTEDMVERALDAPVVGDCTAIEYLDFTASDAKELGVHIEGENFAKLSDIRHEQWRDTGRAIVRRILTAALQLNKKG